MGAIAVVFLLLAVVAGLASTVCFVLVLVEMFKRQQTGIAVACIVLFFCTGAGPLVAFIYGWMKAGEWNLRKIMLAWTGCIAVSLLAGMIWLATSASRISELQRKMEQEMQQNFKPDELKLNIETK